MPEFRNPVLDAILDNDDNVDYAVDGHSIPSIHRGLAVKYVRENPYTALYVWGEVNKRLGIEAGVDKLIYPEDS